MAFSEDFKKMVVTKYYQTPRPTLRDLASEFGISPATIHQWLKERKNDTIDDKPVESKRPKDWTHAEKLQALLDSAGLSEQELGGFCRKQGIHSHQLTKWRVEMMSNEPSKVSIKQRNELKALRAENKALKKDLRRKEKALAETSALLILKKKADLIWGESEDD